MMRALYSGVSGLKVHQTKMDVIGNNISNVNTVGFRGSTVNFTDVFYQTHRMHPVRTQQPAQQERTQCRLVLVLTWQQLVWT